MTWPPEDELDETAEVLLEEWMESVLQAEDDDVEDEDAGHDDE